MRFLKKSIIGLIIFGLVLSSTLSNGTIAYAAEKNKEKKVLNNEFEVTFEIVDEWCDSYNMSVSIKNIGNESVKDWVLIYSSEDLIDTIWNANVICCEGKVCYLKNAGWNKEIKPGEEVSFGYIGKYNEKIQFPNDISLLDDDSSVDEIPDYILVDSVESEYGTIYYVEENNGIQVYTLWDAVDILMAGSSWADMFKNPSWGNFAWAVLDTVALIPALPSTAYVRKGGKVLLKADEVAKFAKTSKGKKIVEAAMKGYKYSDGISPKAIKSINKTFNTPQESKKVLNLFKAAANRGLVGATNQMGIKKLTGKYKNKYTHEIKLTGKYGAYRIFGYKEANGKWTFDYFVKAHK